MSTVQSNNKRIAKNTLKLYFRMIFLMLISLFTSRIVLANLGETDYGLYSVVGGIVVILSFLNGSMAGATQRFLNFEMGRRNQEGLRRVFSTAICIHALIAVVVFILAETIGLWFLNTYMNIPPDRMRAANCVYQFSVASFLVSVLSVPYNAAIIAHEHMSAFAYISILEAVLKLLVAYLIQVILYDKLITYALLIFLVGVMLRIIYGVYCSRHFKECHFYRSYIDKALAKQMLFFSSWTIVGNLGYLSHTQGVAICINLFFGPSVNAAQGVSNSVNSKVSGFVSNFQTALNPQIVQNYAAGRIDEMHSLMFRGCRFSFFLISFFAIPLIIEAPTVLGIWLKEVPNYTVIFVRLVLTISIVNSYSGVMATSQGATGKIKYYQTVLAATGWLHVPFTLLLFYWGLPPQSTFWIYLVIVIVLQLQRILFVSHSTHMSKRLFAMQVIAPCLLVLILSSIVPALLHLVWHGGFWVFAVKCLISFLCTGTIVLTLGMQQRERQMILETIKNKLQIKQ